MKKAQFLVLVYVGTIMYLLCINHKAEAQTIIPPGMAEYKNPIAATANEVGVVAHVSNYHFENTVFALGDAPGTMITNSLFVWAWGAINTMDFSGCGIGWKRTGTDPNVIIDEGFINLNKFVYDPEIAFIQHQNIIYVVLAYYQSLDYFGVGTPGHKYDIYRWDSGSLTPVSLGNVLSTSTVYSRISIDAHRLYALAITWETANGIFVKGINTVSGTMVVSPSVLVATSSGGRAPDIAFAHHDSASLRIRLFYNIPFGSGDETIYKIEHRDFNDIFSTTAIPFIFDYDFEGVYSKVNGLDGLYAQIDCPDHSTVDRWAVTYYNFIDNQAFLRIYTPTSPPTAIAISESFFTYPNNKIGCISVAYDYDPSLIHAGFHNANHTPPYNTNFYAVSYREDNFKYTLAPGEFKAIANLPYSYVSTHSLSFSKQNDATNHLFTSYNAATSTMSAINAEIRHKHGFYSTVHSTFSDKIELEIASLSGLSVIPNPIMSNGSLHFNNMVLEETAVLQLIDAYGSVIFQSSGDQSHLASTFQQKSHALTSGTYLLHIQSGEKKYSTKFIKY